MIDFSYLTKLGGIDPILAYARLSSTLVQNMDNMDKDVETRTAAGPFFDVISSAVHIGCP